MGLESLPTSSQHTTTGKLPKLTKRHITVCPCRNRKCITCTHLNCNLSFTSTVTKQKYPIRFSATCTTFNIIYLVTCTKCKKQYVGYTRNQLNERVNKHRSTILRDETIYFCIHFNLPGHDLNNISIQVIDKANTLNELRRLEKFWIKTLRTLQPLGLNCSPGECKINPIIHAQISRQF